MRVKLLLRSLSILLISVFLWSQVGPVAVLCSRVVHYRDVRAASGSDRENDTLTISKEALPDVVWIEKDEIRYRDRMFDVVVRVDNEEQVSFIGHFDQKDEDLFTTLCSFLEYGTEDEHTDDAPVMLLEFDAVLHDTYRDAITYTAECEAEDPLFSASNYRFFEKEALFQPPKAS